MNDFEFEYVEEKNETFSDLYSKDQDVKNISVNKSGRKTRGKDINWVFKTKFANARF